MDRACGYWVGAGRDADPPAIPEPVRSADLHSVSGPRVDGARLELDRRVHRLRRVWQRRLLWGRGLYHRAADAFQMAGGLFFPPLFLGPFFGGGFWGFLTSPLFRPAR